LTQLAQFRSVRYEEVGAGGLVNETRLVMPAGQRGGLVGIQYPIAEINEIASARQIGAIDLYPPPLFETPVGRGGDFERAFRWGVRRRADGAGDPGDAECQD